MNKIIRHAKNSDDVYRVSLVSQSAFATEKIDWCHNYHNFVTESFGFDFISLCEIDDKIVSSLVATPQPVYIAETAVPHSAVGNVGTLEDYRKMGLANDCLKLIHETFKERDICLSSLSPFSYHYYRRPGWEIGCTLISYIGDKNAFLELEQSDGTRPFNTKDLTDIKAIYSLWAKNYNCSTCRSDLWWDRFPDLKSKISDFSEEDEARIIVDCDTNNEIKAYALINYGYDEEEASENFGKVNSINIPELAFIYPKNRRHILSYLRKRYPLADISFVAPADDDFINYLPNPRLYTKSIHSGFQFRVHNPLKAVSYLRPTDSGTLSFDITDPFEDNNWQFTASWSDRKIDIKPGIQNINVVHTSIQRFAQFYNGYTKVSEHALYDYATIEGNTKEIMSLAANLFPKNTPYRDNIEPG